jgi:hypothetical protein
MPGNTVELWSGCWALQVFFFVLGAMQYCELQVQVFFTLRLALGLLSAVTEATLVAVVTRRYGARMGMYTLGILCISSGCFNASTSMYVHWLLFPYCQICRIASCCLQEPSSGSALDICCFSQLSASWPSFVECKLEVKGWQPFLVKVHKLC